MSQRVHPRSGRRRAGMAMVEFLIVLPVLITLLFATVEFGVVLKRWQTLSNAAREGARLAAVGRENCDAGTLETAITTRVKEYADSAGIDPDSVMVTNTSGLCSVGNVAEITVEHTYTFQVLAGFSESLTPVVVLTARSAMRTEESE